MFRMDIPHADTGHTTFTFDPSKPEEVEAAQQQFNDLSRMGYAIFVEQDGQTNRVTEFDAARGVYKIGAKEIPAAGATATAAAPASGGCIAR